MIREKTPGTPAMCDLIDPLSRNTQAKTLSTHNGYPEIQAEKKMEMCPPTRVEWSYRAAAFSNWLKAGSKQLGRDPSNYSWQRSWPPLDRQKNGVKPPSCRHRRRQQHQPMGAPYLRSLLKDITDSQESRAVTPNVNNTELGSGTGQRIISIRCRWLHLKKYDVFYFFI